MVRDGAEVVKRRDVGEKEHYVDYEFTDFTKRLR